MTQQFYPNRLGRCDAGAIERLANLRREIEAETGGLGDAALLLADVCIALNLSEAEYLAGMGQDGADYVRQWGDEPIMLKREGDSASQSRQ